MEKIPQDYEKIPAERDRVLILDTASSTNTLLLQMAREGAPDGQVLIADRQTAGRGRLGRSFASPAGMGIYLSYLIRLTPEEKDIASFTALTSRTAVAVSHAVSEVCGVTPKIKWVNDLYLGKPGKERKICGILAQAETDAQTLRIATIVIGIGLNVHEETADFPEEIAGIAGSLFSETGKHYLRGDLALSIIRRMDRLRLHLSADHGEDLAHIRAHSLLTGQSVTVSEGDRTRTGYALGIGDDYGLKVRWENGSEEVLRSGDVSVRLKP